MKDNNFEITIPRKETHSDSWYIEEALSKDWHRICTVCEATAEKQCLY